MDATVSRGSRSGFGSYPIITPIIPRDDFIDNAIWNHRQLLTWIQTQTKLLDSIHQWSLCGAMMKEWQFCDGGKQGGEGTVYRDANTHKHLQ